MKIIYSGGWNKDLQESVEGNFIHTYSAYLKKYITSGKKVCFITLAKPDGYFDNMIISIYGDIIEIINSQSQNIDWSSYDALFIPGGDPTLLKNQLLDKGFEIKGLNTSAIVLGDSAGAYVLSSYFYSSPPGDERGRLLTFAEGFNSDAKLITMAHMNNPVYYNETLQEKVNEFAEKMGLQILKLVENQQVIKIENEFVGIEPSNVFLDTK